MTLLETNTLIPVSIIICTRNRAQSLGRTLEALEHVIMPDGVSCEVLVVDNGSKDQTFAVVQSAKLSRMSLRYVLEPTVGQVHARNAGLAAARGKIILYTDDDVHPSVEWLSHHLRAYDDPRVAAVLGRIELEFESPPPRWFGRRRLRQSPSRGSNCNKARLVPNSKGKMFSENGAAQSVLFEALRRVLTALYR